MRKLEIKLAKTLILLFIGALVIIGCEKKDLAIQENITTPDKQIDIDVLIAYLSEITGIKVDDISYDESTTQFKAFNVNQISRKDLTKSFINNNNK